MIDGCAPRPSRDGVGGGSVQPLSGDACLRILQCRAKQVVVLMREMLC
jgi:hypothetical protein